MFLLIIEYLATLDSGFQVFNYLTLRAVLSMLSSLFLILIFGRFFISRLHRYQIGQVVRDDGPKSHLIKTGTPTMGGVLILFAFLLSVVIWSDLTNSYIWLTLLAAILFGGIGFLDDYLKVICKSPHGLRARQKLLLQSLTTIALFFGFLFWVDTPLQTYLLVPFLKNAIFPLGVAGLFLIFYVVLVGTSNAVNLTDGLDGLAIIPVVLVSGALGVFAYISGNYNFSDYLNMPFMLGSGELVIVCSALIGSGLGFLWFNAYPADVFMGDVGSLSLGGVLAMVAVLLRQEILLLIMGGVFVAEALSVMLQVGSYKLSGKRIFLMAPLHHHYEKKGLAEPKIIVRFWIVTLILVLIGLASIKIR